MVLARAAQAEDDQKAAIDLLRKAAETQDTIPYMEPPFWYYPVRQSLGAALLKTGQPDEAEKEFRMALERERSSAWALYGLKEAAKAKGDAAAEQKAADELAKAWRGDPGMLTLGTAVGCSSRPNKNPGVSAGVLSLGKRSAVRLRPNNTCRTRPGAGSSRSA